jgi:hypothetical protein
MIGHAGPEDVYSAEFDLVFERSTVPHISEVKKQPELKLCKARSDFMSSQLNVLEILDTKELNSVIDNEKTVPEPQEQAVGDNKENVCSLSSQHSALEGQNIDHASCSPSNISSINVVDKSRSKVTSESSFVNIDSTSPHNSGGNEVTKSFSTKSNISSVGDSLFSENSVPLKVSSDSVSNVGDGEQLEGRNDSAALEGDHDKELNLSGDVPSSIVKRRLKLFEKSGDTEGYTKASKTISSRKCALYQKDETISAPLYSLITRATSVKPTDENVLVEEDKVEMQKGQQKGQDGQEKVVGETDTSKEKSRFETDEIIEIVSQHLKNESQSCIGDSFECIDTEDRMVNMNSSSISDLPKDTSSIKVIKFGDIQTNLASPNNTVAKCDSDNTYPSELNPFGDDDDDDDIEKTSKEIDSHMPSERKVAQEINTFGSSNGEEGMQIMVDPPTPPVPVTRERRKKLLEAPEVNLNPFWSDGEEPSSGDENAGSTHSTCEKFPVPRPRTVM